MPIGGRKEPNKETPAPDVAFDLPAASPPLSLATGAVPIGGRKEPNKETPALDAATGLFDASSLGPDPASLPTGECSRLNPVCGDPCVYSVSVDAGHAPCPPAAGDSDLCTAAALEANNEEAEAAGIAMLAFAGWA